MYRIWSEDVAIEYIKKQDGRTRWELVDFLRPELLSGQYPCNSTPGRSDLNIYRITCFDEMSNAPEFNLKTLYSIVL